MTEIKRQGARTEILVYLSLSRWVQYGLILFEKWGKTCCCFYVIDCCLWKKGKVQEGVKMTDW